MLLGGPKEVGGISKDTAVRNWHIKMDTHELMESGKTKNQAMAALSEEQGGPYPCSFNTIKKICKNLIRDYDLRNAVLELMKSSGKTQVQAMSALSKEQGGSYPLSFNEIEEICGELTEGAKPEHPKDWITYDTGRIDFPKL